MKYYMRKAKYWKHMLKEHYLSHGVKIKVVRYQIYPHLHRYIYIVKPSKGARKQRIFDRAGDIQSALGLYLVKAEPDGSYIRIVVFEREVKENRLLKILESPKFSNSKMQIPLAIGYDLMGDMCIADLAELVHLLIIGPTGTGKSVAIQCIILSIITRCSADDVKLLLFDVRSNSLSLFNDAAHLYHPIVKDVETGIVVLESLVAEMDRRYGLEQSECEKAPYIVCIIDEFDELISGTGDGRDSKRLVSSINSLIRSGRKTKIILILASHDPVLKNVKVDINGIVPRIAFQVLKHHSSSTALGVVGADKLPGDGALLFKSGASEPRQLQGSYVTSAEIERILSTKPADYDDADMLELIQVDTEYLSTITDGEINRKAAIEKANRELAAIILWTFAQQKVSVSKIQEKVRSRDRANAIMDEMCRMEIVSERHANQPRDVIPKCFDDVPAEVLGFMLGNGITEDDVRNAFQKS